MSNSNTWRVQYFRDHSPYPVSHYFYGEQAEAEARAKGDNLQQTEAARGVSVDRIERPADGRGGTGKLSAKRASTAVDSISLDRNSGAADD